MSDEHKNVISVVIGCDVKLAAKLRRRFGGRVYAFGASYGFALRLLPYVRFRRVRELTSDTLSMYINWLAEKHFDKIPVVAASEKYSEMLAEMRADVESGCIIFREDLTF